MGAGWGKWHGDGYEEMSQNRKEMKIPENHPRIPIFEGVKARDNDEQ